MRRAIWLYIQDILENMHDAEVFVQGMTYEQFVQDKRTLNAVLRSLQVIGEATKRVPDPVRNGIHKCHGGRWLECVIRLSTTTWMWIPRLYGVC